MYNRYNFILLTVFLLLSVSGVFAQKTCFFVKRDGSDYVSGDATLVAWLTAEGYVVATEATDGELNINYYSVEEIEANDFVFISESVDSKKLESLRGLNVPILTLEMWVTKQELFGWCPHSTSGLYYENSTENTVRILDGSHPLAAGFATDAEVDLTSGTDDENYTNYSNPQINHIPIAELITTADDPQLTVFGIEEGTWLYQAVDTDPDGSEITGARIAAVGINADANNHITDDGYKFIKAGIDWIINETAIDGEPELSPNSYTLDQNYPNPFNPYTHISYTLEKGGFVNLIVYDVTGREVAILVNGNSAAGKNMVNFNASNLNSGVYFYTLTVGDYKETRKMMLIK